jgi:hypothetical protein
MKVRSPGRKLLLCGVLFAALPGAGLAQSNGPGGGRAVVVDTLTVTGMQTIAEEGDCSEVVVNVAGSLTGTVDDGGGFDQVSVELWDDGTMKDSQVVSIPVDTTQPIDVTLSFLGLYLTGAPGVGVLVVDIPGLDLLLNEDPFFPTDVLGTCPICDTPIAGCRPAGKSVLLVKNNLTDDGKDKLVWKWVKGAETSLPELGDPTATTTYTLCLYAGSDLAAVELPPGASWKALGTKGFKFKDLTGAPDGGQKAILKSGAAGKAKALVKAKGSNLPDTLAPPLPLPVTAQLVNNENGTCFEATYATAIKNDQKKFMARTP